MRAFCLVRDKPWYRRAAIAAGLVNAGHDVLLRSPDRFDRETLLVIWNRYGEFHQLALAVERGGGRVVVVENGYLNAGGSSPKFDVYNERGGEEGHYYAIAEGWHNGFGRWPIGGPERFERLGVDLAPMRSSGEVVLVCPNRSFGVPGRTMMDMDWAKTTSIALRKISKLPIVVRPHPGNDAPKRPLALDLARARAVVIWSSSAGVHALAAGVPVFALAPNWILKAAALSDIKLVDSVDPETVVAPRLEAFRAMAWAQWTVAEISTGEPFRRLLS